MLSLDIVPQRRNAASDDAGAPQASAGAGALSAKNWRNLLNYANVRRSTVSKACVKQIIRRDVVAARPGNEESRRPLCPRPLLPLSQPPSAWLSSLAVTRTARKNSRSSSRFSRSIRSRLPAPNTADRSPRGMIFPSGRVTALMVLFCAVSGRGALPC